MKHWKRILAAALSAILLCGVYFAVSGISVPRASAANGDTVSPQSEPSFTDVIAEASAAVIVAPAPGLPAYRCRITPASNYLDPALIADVVHEVNGSIVECNTAYEGPRHTTESHEQVLKDHGFTTVAPCEILDATGEIEYPVKNHNHLNNISHTFNEYSMISLIFNFFWI